MEMVLLIIGVVIYVALRSRKKEEEYSHESNGKSIWHKAGK